MTPSTLRRFAAATTAVLLSLSALSACSAPGGQLDTDRNMAASCPTTALASSIYVDATGSAFSEQNKALHLDAIDRVVVRTATCGGLLSVQAFGSSSGQTVPIYSGSLSVEAPTEKAERRKAEKLADEVSSEIRGHYDEAIGRVHASSTDVVGLLRLIKEAQTQRPDAAHEDLILTDGFTNVSVDPSSVSSTEDAQALAYSLNVPDLSGVTLRIIGVGRSSTEVPSAVIERVTAFWERLCERTGASCTVATNWQG